MNPLRSLKGLFLRIYAEISGLAKSQPSVSFPAQWFLHPALRPLITGIVDQYLFESELIADLLRRGVLLDFSPTSSHLVLDLNLSFHGFDSGCRLYAGRHCLFFVVPPTQLFLLRSLESGFVGPPAVHSIDPFIELCASLHRIISPRGVCSEQRLASKERCGSYPFVPVHSSMSLRPPDWPSPLQPLPQNFFEGLHAEFLHFLLPRHFFFC